MLLHCVLICVVLTASQDFVLASNQAPITPQLGTNRQVRADYIHTPGVGYHKLHTRAVFWSDARRICNQEGGHLAIVNSIAEEIALKNIFRQSNPVVGSLLPDRAFVGITDMQREGEWITVFDQPLSTTGYSNWAIEWLIQQPDNALGNENCGTFLKDGGLADVSCYWACAFFCELPLPQVPVNPHSQLSINKSSPTNSSPIRQGNVTQSVSHR